MDTVEIVMNWEEAFGLTMPDSAAAKVETPAQAVDYWCERLNASEEVGSCLTWLAFKRLRDGLATAGAISRNRIKLDTTLASLWKREGRSQFWNRFVHASGFSKLRKPGLVFGPKTVRDLLLDALTSEVRQLIRPDGKWSRQDVRTVVRAIVRDYVRRPFRDEEHFIRDLGLD